MIWLANISVPVSNLGNMENVPDDYILDMMRRFGLHGSKLSGAQRARSSSRNMPTMSGRLADPIEYFRRAMSIEMEDGSANPATNVTRDGLSSTSKIVAAHILGVEHGKPKKDWVYFPAYYDWLIWMEHEGPRRP